MAYQVNCIKCKTQYDEIEDDPYYCPSCLEEKKLIAAQIDAKLGSTVGQKPSGLLQQYDSLTKIRGFVKAKDLGL